MYVFTECVIVYVGVFVLDKCAEKERMICVYPFIIINIVAPQSSKEFITSPLGSTFCSFLTPFLSFHFVVQILIGSVHFHKA